MLGLFTTIVALALVVALVTGRAYFGQPFRYVDRSEHPFFFWVIVAFS